MGKLILKSTGIWFVMVLAAIINGLFREQIMIPGLGISKALPLSGVFLSLFILAIAAISIGSLGRQNKATYFYIGAFWVILTIIFEVVLGYFITGKSWNEILKIFNILEGNLFILVLTVSFLAPWVTAKLRKII